MQFDVQTELVMLGRGVFLPRREAWQRRALLATGRRAPPGPSLMMGSPGDPVRLDPWQTITEVGWGELILVVTVQIISNITFSDQAWDYPFYTYGVNTIQSGAPPAGGPPPPPIADPYRNVNITTRTEDRTPRTSAGASTSWIGGAHQYIEMDVTVSKAAVWQASGPTASGLGQAYNPALTFPDNLATQDQITGNAFTSQIQSAYTIKHDGSGRVDLNPDDIEWSEASAGPPSDGTGGPFSFNLAGFLAPNNGPKILMPPNPIF